MFKQRKKRGGSLRCVKKKKKKKKREKCEDREFFNFLLSERNANVSLALSCLVRTFCLPVYQLPPRRPDLIDCLFGRLLADIVTTLSSWVL